MISYQEVLPLEYWEAQMCLEVSMLSGSYFLRGPPGFVGLCQWGALKMGALPEIQPGLLR